MPPLVRTLVAVLGGVVAGLVVIVACDALAGSLYPLPIPEGIDPNDPDMRRAAFAVLPANAFLIVLAGWMIAAVVGGWVAAKLAARSGLLHAMALGGVLLAAGLANLMAVPHPFWMWVGGIVGFPLGAFAGGRLAVRV